MEFFFHFLLGFSIKAVPFPNAILNVKELGGKKLLPNLTRKEPDFHFSSPVKPFLSKTCYEYHYFLKADL